MTDRTSYNVRDCELTTISCLNNLSKSTKEAVKYLWIYSNKITNLEGLENFTNLYYLNIFGNSLSDINGLKNSTKIEYMRLADNTFSDSDEKENEKDSLYILQNLKELCWLDIAKNSGIKHISYLKDLTKLKYLYMDGCSSLSGDEVAEMSIFINGMSGKTYDSKYEKKLIDPEKQTVLSYYNETIDLADFKKIGECTKLTQLNLRNTKVEKSATDTLASSENNVESLMNSVFNNLSNLQYLTINNLTIKIDGETEEKISDLEFLPSSVVFVDLSNTDVIAKGDMSGSDENLDDTNNGLSIKNTDKLNDLENLRSIGVSTDKFDFSKLQQMLERFDLEKNLELSDKTFMANSGYFRGLMCTNWNSLKTLEKCSDITKIVAVSRIGGVSNNKEEVLDLSDCNNLESVTEFGWSGFTVKFPNTISRISTVMTRTHFDFEDSLDGNPLYISLVRLDETSGENMATFITELRDSNVEIDKLDVQSYFSDFDIGNYLLRNGVCDWINILSAYKASYQGDCYDCRKFFESLSNLSNTEEKLKKLTITSFDFQNYPFENLSCLKSFTNLKNLSLKSSKVISLSDMEPIYDMYDKCVSGFPSLETLSIVNPVVSSITDITSVEKLTNLKRIDFTGNQINNGIEALSELTNLEYVNLTNCSSLSQNRKLC